MMNIYNENECAIIYTTRDTFGTLSNFSPHHVALFFNEKDYIFKTSEAFYQALKFPDNPEVQEQIFNAHTPKQTKQIAQANAGLIRPDWHSGARVEAMRLVLHFKYMQHPAEINQLFKLAAERKLKFVEKSRFDDYWGAKPQGDGRLIGVNTLGQLWQEIADNPLNYVVNPPMPNFDNCRMFFENRA